MSTVLVAHDNETIRGVIEVVLKRAGYKVLSVSDGDDCVPLLHELLVDALVLDVAISGTFVVEIIDAARACTPRVPVVLVASVYNRTSYKRRPSSLYGADDYVEQHHITDSLIPKLVAVGTAAPEPAAPMREHDAEVRVAGEAELAQHDEERSSDAAITRAERLARLIVSDIALYNGDAVLRAREGDLGELEARLRTDLEEGRLLFDLRVPLAVRRQRDFIADALRDLVERST
ncbi:MAG: response regulator [Polyangia bacterium]